MGYKRHHAIMATSFSKEKAEAAHSYASLVCEVCSVSDLNVSSVNDYHSFCIFPDGSKEGWEHSDKGDIERNKVVRYFRELGGVDWVMVQYGDEEGQVRVVDASDYDRAGLIY